MKTYKAKIRKALDVKEERIRICERSLFLFGLYYFSHYFFRPSASFHKEMAKDAMFKDHRFLMWVMFREAAKTVWARIKVVHAICYKKKLNILWICHDLKKASKHVMAISSELKGNEKIIEDFGQLFWEDKTELKKRSKSKTFSTFTSTNGVTIKAASTLITARGDIEGQFRPDLVILDDIENLKTVRSIVITKGVIDYLEELIGGMAVDCDTLILCNKLAHNGSVAWLEKHLEQNPKAIIHEVPLIKDGVITWPEKYVMTDEEAEKLNAKIMNSKRHYVSVESKKRDLGSIAFDREMQLKPLDSAGSPISMEWIVREALPDLSTLDLVVGVDPAVKVKETADYFSMCLAGRHRSTGKIYIIKVYKTRCKAPQQVKLIKLWHDLYPRARFKIETVAYQEALAQFIEAERENGIYIPVDSFKPSGDKMIRVMSVSPFIERGDVVFADLSSMDEPIKNLCSFPFTDDGHDDDVDSITAAIEHFVKRRKRPGLAVA